MKYVHFQGEAESVASSAARWVEKVIAQKAETVQIKINVGSTQWNWSANCEAEWNVREIEPEEIT